MRPSTERDQSAQTCDGGSFRSPTATKKQWRIRLARSLAELYQKLGSEAVDQCSRNEDACGALWVATCKMDPVWGRVCDWILEHAVIFSREADRGDR